MPPQTKSIEDIYKQFELDMLYAGKSSGMSLVKNGKESGGLKSWLERNAGKEQIVPLLEFATGAISREEEQKGSALELAIGLPFLGRFYKGTRLGLKNIKKAQKIHQGWVKRLEKSGEGYVYGSGDIAHHRKLVKDKDIAINALEGKGNYSDAKNIINKWKGTHVKVKEWLKVANKESTKKWMGGDIKHQDEWIKNYDQALEELDKIYLK